MHKILFVLSSFFLIFQPEMFPQKSNENSLQFKIMDYLTEITDDKSTLKEPEQWIFNNFQSSWPNIISSISTYLECYHRQDRPYLRMIENDSNEVKFDIYYDDSGSSDNWEGLWVLKLKFPFMSGYSSLDIRHKYNDVVVVWSSFGQSPILKPYLKYLETIPEEFVVRWFPQYISEETISKAISGKWKLLDYARNSVDIKPRFEPFSVEDEVLLEVSTDISGNIVWEIISEVLPNEIQFINSKSGMMSLSEGAYGEQVLTLSMSDSDRTESICKVGVAFDQIYFVSDDYVVRFLRFGVIHNYERKLVKIGAR